MKTRLLAFIAFVLATLSFVAPLGARTIYVTADNTNGTNLFGTLDLRTGKFTQIAQTTPLIYALTTGPDGRLYGADINTGSLFTISPEGVATPYGSVTAPGFPDSGESLYGYMGLVYDLSAEHFLAVNVDPVHVSLYKITKHGRQQKDLGIIEGPDTGIFFSGSLTFGPFKDLYFDFIPASGPQLYVIDPSTGAPTPIGNGLGTDILVLFSDGNKLFGIDADSTSDIGIYSIDVKTGIATSTGVSVTGLPNTNDFYIDTATVCRSTKAAAIEFHQNRCDPW